MFYSATICLDFNNVVLQDCYTEMLILSLFGQFVYCVLQLGVYNESFDCSFIDDHFNGMFQ